MSIVCSEKCVCTFIYVCVHFNKNFKERKKSSRIKYFLQSDPEMEAKVKICACSSTLSCMCTVGSISLPGEDGGEEVCLVASVKT